MEVFANFNNAGTFNAQQTSVTGIQGGSLSKFNNSGIFNKTEAGSMIIAADFNNTGSLNVQMGTLLLFRTNNATGAYDVSNGATLEFTNAIHKLNTGSSVAGLGTVKFSGGTVNISDTYNITGASEFTGGFVIFHPTSTLTSLGAGPLAVAAGSVTFNTDGPPIAVTTLDLSGGTITGTDDITASGLLTWTGSSTMSGTGATTANAGMSLNSTTTMSLGRALTNPGGQTATWLDGDIQIDSGGQFDNLGIFSADHPDDQCICGGNTVTFNNVGTFNNIGIGITTIDVNFINNSPLNVIAGTLKLQAGSTSEEAYDVSAGATLEFTGGVHNLIAGSSLVGAGTASFTTGTVTIDGTYDVTGTTLFAGATVAFAGPYTQTGGSTLLTGGNLSSTQTITIQGGVLGGGGTVSAPNVSIDGGEVSPGLSTDILNIIGNYEQIAAGTFSVEINGTTPGTDFDQLNITGAAALNGTLDITKDVGFDPAVGTEFQIATFASRTGEFTTVNTSAFSGKKFVPIYSATDVVLQVQLAPAAGADLSLTKIVDDATPNEGDPVTYTITITNDGPDTATNIEVEDLLATGVTLGTASVTQGTYTAGTGVWSVGTVASAASATLTLPVTVDSGTGGSTITNRAEVIASDQGDPDSTPDNDVPSEDDQDSASITVQSGTVGLEGRMTGGGSVFDDSSGVRVSHGFTLHCDIGAGPNNLQVNWGKGNKFHLEGNTLTSAFCSDNSNENEGKPIAGFDTFVGSGTGRLNGVSGHTIEFTLTDFGEPGKGVDLATIKIDGGAVLDVSGTIQGNHQAHPEK